MMQLTNTRLVHQCSHLSAISPAYDKRLKAEMWPYIQHEGFVVNSGKVLLNFPEMEPRGKMHARDNFHTIMQRPPSELRKGSHKLEPPEVEPSHCRNRRE